MVQQNTRLAIRAVAGACALAVAGAARAQFDTGILEERGINPRIAEYFRDAPRFYGGVQVVNVTVNGIALGRKQALFDAEGRLCFTAEFVSALGLAPMTDAPGTPPGVVPKNVVCPDYRTFSPRALVLSQASMSAVDITVPNEHVRLLPTVDRTERGGIGGMFNYRGYITSSHSGSGTSYQYRYVDMTAGINAGDWLLRSMQDYSDVSGLRWRAAYVQKTFEDWEHTAHFGRITSQDPIFGGLPLTGVQWIPERGLYARNASYAVTGVAASRSRVEIRQNGTVVLRTVVPPGPFSITDYVAKNATADLEVKVVDDSGAEQSFRVPASALLESMADSEREGWSVAAGLFWDQSQSGLYRNSPVVSFSRSWSHDPLSGTSGALVSTTYGAVGTSLAFDLPEHTTSVSVQGQVSHDRRSGQVGWLGGASASKSFGADWRFGLTGGMRSADYRGVQENLLVDQPAAVAPAGSRSQFGATLSWNAPFAGALSAGVTRETYFAAAPANSMTLNWGYSWRGMTFAAGVSRRAARPGAAIDASSFASATPASRVFYFNVSMPLGTNMSVRAYHENNDGRERTGVGFEHRVRPDLGYRGSAETTRSASGQSRSSSVSVYGLPYYLNLNAGMVQSISSTNVYVDFNGAAVATGAGIALTPYTVADNFGTIETGDIARARILTPQGPVWSWFNGLAAVSGLAPYRESRIELAGNSVDEDIQIDNGLQVLEVSRGAVVRINLGMHRVRRKMLIVTMPDGSLLPSGTVVLRGNEKEYFTLSEADGRILLTDNDADAVLEVDLLNGGRCVIGEMKTLPKIDWALFETASATCRPVGVAP